MRKTLMQNRINEYRSQTVQELSAYFGVSVETVRRDLAKLEALGKVSRVRGGAVSVCSGSKGDSFEERSVANLDKKKTLVKRAVDLITEGMTIALDASTSTWCLAMMMKNIPCTVITNSNNAISALKTKEKIKIVCVGGVYSERYDAFYDVNPAQSFGQYKIDLGFISCSGFGYGMGIWDTNDRNLQVKRAILGASDHSVLLADSTKMGMQGTLKVCDIEEVDLIVSDRSSILSSEFNEEQLRDLVVEISQSLILIDRTFDTKEAVIQELSNKLQAAGFVKESFAEAVIEREQKYATGLQAENMAIAIPHTDKKHVNKSAIAFASLSKSVRWGEMATESDEVDAELVMMLAIGDGTDHMDSLNKVIGIVSEPKTLASLKSATEPNQVAAILTSAIGETE